MKILLRTPKFGDWIWSERIAETIHESFKKELSKVPEKMLEYLAKMVRLPKWIYTYLPWDITIKLFFLHRNLVKINPIPLTRHGGKTKDNNPVAWDYEGRGWFYWLHLMARTYGWSVEYVQNLDVNTALPLLQEILVDDHLEKEFYYSLSEIAYPYDKTTKQSRFKPMQRPYYMWQPAPELKRIPIPKRLIPHGAIDVSGMQDYLAKKHNNQSQ